MRITTKLVKDISTGRVLEWKWYPYKGFIAEMKASQQQKDAASQNQAFTTQLQGQFGSEFGSANGVLSGLTGNLNSVLQNAMNGNGFSPAELSAMRSSSTEQNTANFQNSQTALNRQTAAMGGGVGVPSGAALQLNEQNAAAGAASNAAGQRNITIANAQQANSNMFGALSGLQGVAGTYGTLASGVGNMAVQNASNSYNEVTQAYQPSNVAANLLGGLAGGALNMIAPGVGSALGGAISGMGGNQESDSDIDNLNLGASSSGGINT